MHSAIAIPGAVFLAAGANAIQVDINSVSSIRDAAKTVAANVVGIYQNQQHGIPGLFPMPYYWWEAGLAWDTLVNYWSLTGDATYNDLVSEALLFQVGSGKDYMPVNQTKSLGNDDQSTWALAAMTAAEAGFPAPPSSSGVHSWVQLAQNVFDSQVPRWDTQSCGGGLRWQIYTYNIGYNYKNAMSNGNFMQLAARLAKHFPSNQTYAEWATKASTWSFDVGLITNGSYNVYDGVEVTDNCKQPSPLQWTANLGTYLSVYAYLSAVGAAPGLASDLLGNVVKVFAKNNILTEVACSNSSACNSDQKVFRGILARAMAFTRDVDTTGNINTNEIKTILQASAKGAAAQCSGGKNGTTCGSNWASSTWDKTSGLSQELSALEVMLANIPMNGTQTSNGNGSSTGSPSGTSSSFASATASGTGAASSMTRSIVGLLGALVFAIALCA